MTLQVGVKVFLTNPEGKVLILRRSEQHAHVPGKWDIPGGRINPGSSLYENLVREVKEETGLELSSPPTLIAAQDIIKENFHVVRLTYSAEASGEPVLDGVEHTEYRWIEKGEISTFEPLDRYIRELLERLEK